MLILGNNEHNVNLPGGGDERSIDLGDGDRFVIGYGYYVRHIKKAMGKGQE